jgi:hypothetical protein
VQLVAWLKVRLKVECGSGVVKEEEASEEEASWLIWREGKQ